MNLKEKIEKGEMPGTGTWKVIKDHPDYAVSDTGEIFSSKKNKILNKQYTYNGYVRIAIYENGKVFHFRAGVEVAKAFLGDKPGENYQVDHIDRNRTNDSVSNLRWVTQQENLCNRSAWGQRA